jgi:ADP-ribose pyrophosphatase YjhB (NUDIX family)
MERKIIIASGPVIVQRGKLLVNKDSKDNFYKLPGGKIEEGVESLEEACKREVWEENKAKIEIIKPLSPMILWQNPTTKEPMIIMLVHYKAKLLNKNGIKPSGETTEIAWLSVDEIRKGKHNVAPNILFLLKKGEIA